VSKKPWHESDENFYGKNWMLAARKYGGLHGFAEIKHNTPEHIAWRNYFSALGWTPFAFRTITQSREKSWTGPSRWPPSPATALQLPDPIGPA
jgi:hypothetical protein